MTITAPAQGSTLATSSTPVTGTTTPGSAVTIGSADTTTGAPASVTSTTAASDGSFSATVPVSFGSNAITVTATVKGAGEVGGGRSTGYGQVIVTNEGGGNAAGSLPGHRSRPRPRPRGHPADDSALTGLRPPRLLGSRPLGSHGARLLLLPFGPVGAQSGARRCATWVTRSSGWWRTRSPAATSAAWSRRPRCSRRPRRPT
ncbi:MAG: hypothetical protein ACRDOE_07220 [Streptosporangiaceae bacterium]